MTPNEQPTPITDEMSACYFNSSDHADARACELFPKVRTLERSLAERREEVNEDTARLDWLQEDGNIDKVHCDAMSGPGVFFVDGFDSQVGLRRAIDSARAELERTKK